MSSSGVFSAAKLAAKHAFLSEIIKEQQQQQSAACLPSSPSASALASANVDNPSTTPGPVLTSPSSPDGSPYLVDNVDNVGTKTTSAGLSGKEKGKGKGRANPPATPSAPATSSPPFAPAPLPSPGPASTPSGGRKLVTVRRITAVDTTSNRSATKLTVAPGWTVGVPTKRRHGGSGGTSKLVFGPSLEVGHSVIFCEPDTLLPADHGRYGQLFASVGNQMMWKGRKWFRVGTKKVGSTSTKFGGKGQFVSQGVVFALGDVEEVMGDVVRRKRLERFAGGEEKEEEELVDYSAVLGAVKWEPHAHQVVGEKKTVGGKFNNSSKFGGSVGNGSKNAGGPGNVRVDKKGSNGGNGNKKKASSATPPPAAPVKIPSFIKKTDIDRVQNCPNLFTKAKYKLIVYQESVKIDGASMTCYFVPKTSKYFAGLHTPHFGSASFSVLETGRFGVCSKSVDLPYSEDCPYWAAAIKNDVASLLEGLYKQGLGSHRGALAIQGEVVGPTISGNHYNLPAGTKSSFTVFGIWDIETQSRWGPRSVQDFCATHHLSHVEVLGYVKLREIASSHAELLARANARQGEGLVFKSCAGDGRSFKVLSDRWITERGDEVDAKKAMQLAGVNMTSGNALVQESESENVVEPEVKECHTKSVETKFDKLPDTTNFVPTFANAKECLDAAVTWLGRPMTNGEAFAEISRFLLAEQSMNGKGISTSLIKDLGQLVVDNLKFIKPNKNITIHKTVASEDAPLSIPPTAPSTRTILDNSDNHSTPATVIQDTTPATHSNPTTSSTAPPKNISETEPESVCSLWAETATEQDITTNPTGTPPASEHPVNDNNDNNDTNDNVFAGVNWDEWMVCKQNGEMVMIRREDYVPRPRPSYYPSAEELARREAAKREARERRRYRRVF
ncbi:hypothetical protein B0T20DRAFT_349534 [Sordaria brevicollis]|uniref:RNA ligase domain-containing protein n=1 Tax=Sordaria brevicollis TaxID=83679 RepID=A0AAE0PHB2_SORBR|nr:hypothetical protein B0T20DRAFT_349534 [Sordaria brevicollis]